MVFLTQESNTRLQLGGDIPLKIEGIIDNLKGLIEFLYLIKFTWAGKDNN